MVSMLTIGYMPYSEKPKVITNCAHLSRYGRKTPKINSRAHLCLPDPNKIDIDKWGHLKHHLTNNLFYIKEVLI